MAAIHTFDELLGAAAGIPGGRVLVVSPANQETFQAIREARSRLGLDFLLVGDGKRIEAGLPGFEAAEIVNCPDPAGCLATSMALMARGEANILMKGSIDTGTLMKAVMRPESGLRT
ncbi:MAG TPA: hypothetical protein VJ732_16020, partial [Bryobacteraceae bacterium]|nr:hypothetical protein [Bryobacteraceae bacterium]